MISLGHRGFLIIFALTIVLLLVDTSIRKISPFVGGLGSSVEDLVIFTSMIVIYAVVQYLILDFIAKSQLQLQKYYKVVRFFQYALVAILALIALQVIFTEGYSSILMKSVVWINYAMFVILTGLLGYRFLVWSVYNKNRVVVAYGIAMVVLSISGVLTVLYVNNALSGQRDIEYIQSLRSPIAIVASVENIFSSSYFVSSVAAFILTWIATILLLNHYSKKLGKIRYWVLVLIPLIYFLSQFEGIFLDILISFRKADPIIFSVTYTLVFSATKPVGGILFGVAFWSISRHIGNKNVKNYLIVSAYGMILLFTSNQPVGLTLIPYPPFGLITIAFLGIASYLLFIGLFSASMSVALDNKLRTTIKRSALDETKFLETIGTSEMEKQVERRVRYMISKTEADFRKESGEIESSLTESEAKDYIKEVLDEIEKSR